MCKNKFVGVEVNSQEQKEKKKKRDGKWFVSSPSVSHSIAIFNSITVT
jgi:hypothetical protein